MSKQRKRMQSFAVVGASFLAGALFFSLLATLQKALVGGPLTAQGYVVPILFGGCSGLILGIRRHQLRESKKQLEDFYKNIPVGIFRTTRDGKIISVNPALATMLGYSSPQEMLGIPVDKLYCNPERREELLKLLDTTSVVANFFAQMRRKDRSTIWVSLNLRVTTDKQSGIQYLDGTLENITEQVRAENAKDELDQRLLSLVTQAPVGIITINMSGVVTEINPSGLAILGSPGREKTIGMNVLTLPTLAASGISKKFKKALEGRGAQDFETSYTTFWGKETCLHIQIAPQFDAQRQQCGVLCILEDITRQRLAEEARVASEERYYSLTQSAIQAIITSDSAGNINDWNAGAEQIFGYKAEEALGKPLTTIIPEKYQNKHKEGLERVGKTGETRIIGKTVRLHGLRKNGDIFPLEISLSSWKKEKETCYGAIIQDITESIQATRQLERQLSFSQALNKIADVIILHNDAKSILSALVRIIGETLQTDRALIYDILLEKQILSGMYEWLNPDEPDIVATKGPCSLSMFVGGATFMQETRRWLESHAAKRNPHLVLDESAKILHDKMGIRSLLWFPFAFHPTGFYVLVFNQMTHQRQWTSSELGFLSAATQQTSLALQKLALLQKHKRAEDKISALHKNLQGAYDETLEGWANALELRDHETEGHSRRVVDLTIRLARSMHIDEAEMPHIRRGALLHDIGKIGIPDNILFKKGELTQEEQRIMDKHPQYAYELLSPIQYLRPVLDIPYCHHEHWDGSGYPRGLQRDEIPLAARVFAIVDVWDALTHDRPYRKAWSKEQVSKYIRKRAGKYFDPQVVEAFFKLQR